MKILHIISSLTSGGAEIYVRDLSNRMVREGHDVCIVYISDALSVNRSVDFEKSFKDKLRTSNISFLELGHFCRRIPFLGGWRLRQIMKGFTPDIVHTHLYFGLLFAMFSWLSIPLLHTHHSYNLGRGRFFFPVFNQVVNKYIGISEACTKSLMMAGVKNIETIYNGVEHERLLIKKELYFNKNEILVISVGSLRIPKNYSLLINACKHLYLRRPELLKTLKFLIVGEGPLKQDLQELIGDLNLLGNVQLLGNREDVQKLLYEADFFVMSSIWEGLPISLLEAISTGLPVIVTDVGGCREIVENCGAGLVVPPRDINQLSEAIEYMIDNPQEAQMMAESARQNSHKYSIDIAVGKHMNLYRKVINDSHC